MKHNLIAWLYSKKTTLVLLVIYAVLMGIATIVEKFHGTPVAKALFYYSPLFIFLQLLMVVNFVGITIRQRRIGRQHASYLCIHGALVVMLGGALVTHLTGKEGMMHIREGEASNELIVKGNQTNSVEHLDFEVRLVDFVLTRYPGSQSPSSYESFLQIVSEGTTRNEHVYMNNVLDFQGYRFYQASYDEDERGTILAVNHDPYGRAITYTGYILLFAGLFLSIFDRHSRLRRLWKRLDGQYALVALAMLLLGPAPATAQHDESSHEHAQRWGQLPMQSANGRIVPINTFASELVRKFDIADILGHLTPEQWLLSVIAHPGDWSIIPLIEVKDDQLATTMGWHHKRIAYRDAFDERGYYRLAPYVERIYTKNPSERTRHDKQVLKIDDRINILHELLSQQLLRILPNPADTVNYRWMTIGETWAVDSTSAASTLGTDYKRALRAAYASGQWEQAYEALSHIEQYQLANDRNHAIHPKKLKAEVSYNEMNMLNHCKKGYLILGGIMLVLTFVIPNNDDRQRRRKQWVLRVLMLAVGGFFLAHTLSLGMRWYISGYAPWSNSYETMVALSWAAVAVGFLFAERNHLVGALATLFGGIVLFVSSLNWMDPQITPLVPVLKSPWLMAHVASLVMAYGFLGISCMIGTAHQFLSLSRHPRTPHQLAQLSLINEIAMLLGLGLLTIGIFLGAVWANESWGRYWSWDPKETWALITMVVYAIVLHARWMLHCKGRLFNLLAQWAMLAILMTFLGVNYFLSGMHSYGSHDALAGIPVWGYVVFAAFFIIPGLLSFLFGKSKDEKEQ